MKISLFMGVGAACAALVSIPAAAQDTATINQNQFSRSESYQRIDNRGIPNQAPAIALGNIYGLNPCATGVSVGVTTPLVGVGGAFSTIDDECQLRNNAALTVSALKDEALAREIMCAVPVFREAAQRVGRPCMQDGGLPIALRPGVAPDGAGSASLMPYAPRAQSLPPDAIPPAVAPTPVPPANGPGLRGVSVEPGARPAFCAAPGLVIDAYPECRTAARPERSAAAARPAASPLAGPSARPRPSQPAVETGNSLNPASGRISDATRNRAATNGCEIFLEIAPQFYDTCVVRNSTRTIANTASATDTRAASMVEGHRLAAR